MWQGTAGAPLVAEGLSLLINSADKVSDEVSVLANISFERFPIIYFFPLIDIS